MGGRTVCDKVCLSVVSTSASSPTTSLGSLVAGAVRGGSACGQMGFGGGRSQPLLFLERLRLGIIDTPKWHIWGVACRASAGVFQAALPCSPSPIWGGVSGPGVCPWRQGAEQQKATAVACFLEALGAVAGPSVPGCSVPGCSVPS